MDGDAGCADETGSVAAVWVESDDLVRYVSFGVRALGLSCWLEDAMATVSLV